MMKRSWLGWTSPVIGVRSFEASADKIKPGVEVSAVPGFLGSEIRWLEPVTEVEGTKIESFPSFDDINACPEPEHARRHVPDVARARLKHWVQTSRHHTFDEARTDD